jgi:hypothetical protein
MRCDASGRPLSMDGSGQGAGGSCSVLGGAGRGAVGESSMGSAGPGGNPARPATAGASGCSSSTGPLTTASESPDLRSVSLNDTAAVRGAEVEPPAVRRAVVSRSSDESTARLRRSRARRGPGGGGAPSFHAPVMNPRRGCGGRAAEDQACECQVPYSGPFSTKPNPTAPCDRPTLPGTTRARRERAKADGSRTNGHG